MATTTAPAAAGPPDPPPNPPTIPGPAPAADPADGAPAPGGRLAALFQAIDPVTAPTDPPAAAGGTADKSDKPHPVDGALDASAPGTTSESFKAADDLAGKGSDAAGAQHKRSVWKAFGLAAAQRWAKGGGTRNKQIDLEKAKASAHQVKEARTTTVMKSPGITPRNGGGNSGGNGGGKAGGNTGKTTTGNGSTGGGRGGGGSGGGRGNSGSSGSHGTGGGGKGNGSTGGSGKTNSGTGGDKSTSGGGKGAAGSGGSGKSGSDGKAGKQGADGKAGGSGKAGSGTGAGDSGKQKAGDSKGADKDKGKDGAGSSKGDSGQKAGKDGKGGGSGSSGSAGGGKGAAGKDGRGANGSDGVDRRTPLEKSRDTGHGDGSAIRKGVDHVKAYAKGAKDGWDDEKEKNGREHARLDKARDDQRKKDGAGGPGGAAGGKAGDPVDLTKKPEPKDEKPAPLTAKDGAGRVVTITDKDGDDGVSTDVKPLKVNSIDTKTLTLGTDGATSINRKELRNFAQYATKLEAKEALLVKVQEACKALVSEAEEEAKECQDLAEQGKGVEGGEALVEKLNKLAEAAKNQAREAEELAKQAQRAAEMCKVVRTNINTRYEPLYKAIVNSKLTKPAEMRFYNDRGHYATAA